jgi:hypothetical protein
MYGLFGSLQYKTTKKVAKKFINFQVQLMSMGKVELFIVYFLIDFEQLVICKNEECLSQQIFILQNNLFHACLVYCSSIRM